MLLQYMLAKGKVNFVTSKASKCLPSQKMYLIRNTEKYGRKNDLYLIKRTRFVSKHAAGAR